jgi:hypothetical protein
MQGVAAKNDASYDLSRARASVTGRTTIAASTAATPMTPPPSEKSGLAKDLIVILGLPALLLSAGAWYYWETIFPVYRAPSEDAVFDVATGVWDWQSHEGFCKDNPHTVAFTPDRKVMVITSRRPWSDTAAADDRVAVYDISEHTASYIRGHLRDEARTTASDRTPSRTSSSPQQMDTRGIEQTGFLNADRPNWTLSCRDRFAHCASWRGALASSLGRAI